MSLLDYGYRSKCCYAPIRLGRKKLKSNITVKIWICCKCRARDVTLVEYTGSTPSKSTRHPFASLDAPMEDDVDA
jgi:hypothetical protein